MPTPCAAPELWTKARAIFRQLMCFIGVLSGSALAQLSRRGRAELISWLTPLEAMVRKLILIEAAALPNLDLRRPRRPAPPCERKNAACVAARAPVFTLTTGVEHEPTCAAHIRDLGAPMLVRDIWREQARLARVARLASASKPKANVRLFNRIAALQRALERPLLHARRFARLGRRLARRAEPMLRAIVAARARHRPFLFDGASYDRASEAAWEALPGVLSRRFPGR